MAPDLCRNGLHPYGERYLRANGKSECRLCRLDRQRARTGVTQWRVVDTDPTAGWWQPITDPERQARYEAWAAGVDDAIAMVRATEGFDGTLHPGQALGEYLRWDVPKAEKPRRRPITQMVVRCPDCDTPRLWDADCATCAQRKAVARPPSDWRRYSKLSTRARQLQAMARQDAGRLADVG